MNSNLYGVARISTGKQNIERQVRNILAKYPLEYLPYRCPERKIGAYTNRGYRQLLMY